MRKINVRKGITYRHMREWCSLKRSAGNLNCKSGINLPNLLSKEITLLLMLQNRFIILKKIITVITIIKVWIPYLKLQAVLEICNEPT
jgi:hypothetical protein